MLILRQTHGYLGQATNSEPVVYKVDNLVQSSLLSSLMLTQYKIYLLDQLWYMCIICYIMLFLSKLSTIFYYDMWQCDSAVWCHVES